MAEGAYIIESDPGTVYIITYRSHGRECRRSGTGAGGGLSMDRVPWWTQPPSPTASPVIISSLDELPGRGFPRAQCLAMQDIKSLIACVPLSRDKVWGYAGIDIVGRRWTGEDSVVFVTDQYHQPLICIKVRRSSAGAVEPQVPPEPLSPHAPWVCPAAGHP